MKPVIVTDISHALQYQCKNNWAIVRSLKPSIPLLQVANLAPSPELYTWYLQNKNAWSKQLFNEVYVPKFLHDLRNNNTARQTLNYICGHIGTTDFVLSCYCKDEHLCHRSIIAGLLQGVGVAVITDTGEDYSRYYEMYKEVI